MRFQVFLILTTSPQVWRVDLDQAGWHLMKPEDSQFFAAENQIPDIINWANRQFRDQITVLQIAYIAGV